ncbi:MAG: 4Fe-4S binding protein [Bacteroidales bacterium]|nr:4Fe-4S binding protein [Bacteroidales bacterium]
MYISMLNMIRPKVTEKYPENRGRKEMMERFRGLLTMPHNEQNEHKCTACGICMINCPNGTIQVISRKEPDEATGKEKRVLDRHLYDLGSCTFCALCTIACPQDAIAWSPVFEHTVFTRNKLVKQLNREGSKLEVKTGKS